MFSGMCSFQPSGDSTGTLAVKALAEFLGTFFLIQSIIFSVNFQQELAALSIGSTLMVCIYAWGHVSGAHYNPAVSTACWVAGRIGVVEWVIYVLTQLIAGIISGFIGFALCEYECYACYASIQIDGGEGMYTEFDGGEGMYTEFLWTFLLASVVLNTATTCAPGYKNNSFFGLAIGFTVVSGAIAVGGFTGGAFNPAVATGLNLGLTQIDWYEFKFSDWIKAIVFEFIGGILAGIIFMITESVETQTEEATTSANVEAAGITVDDTL